MWTRRLTGTVCSAAAVFLFSAGAILAASTLQGAADLRLPIAAMQGDANTVALLLKQKADVNAAQGDGMTALHWAAYRGDLGMAKTLLAAGASVKATTRDESLTPLAVACVGGNAAMIDLLLQAGSDATWSNGISTALMKASASGSADAVKLLLEHGADVNAKESAHDQTALMFAAGLNRSSVIAVLVAHGADLNALSKLVQLTKPQFDSEGNPVPAGRVGAKAVSQPDKPTVTAMGGMTALHYAARDGQRDAVRALVQAGADVNIPTLGDHSTPLVIAITNGHYEVARFLVDHGADPNVPTVDGLEALYATIDCQWKPVAWEPTPIVDQEKVSYLDLMKDLIDHGADVNAKLTRGLWFRPTSHNGMWVKYSGTTAFWRAAQATDLDAMKLLAARGADPKIGSDQKDTPLAMAAGVGWAGNFSTNAPESFLKSLKYLVEEAGIDVNTQDVQGYTPLMGAAFRGDNESVQYLVEHGAKLDYRTEKGWSVSDMANGPCCFAIGGSLPPAHPETVAFLLTLGAPPLLSHDGEETLGVNSRNKKPKKSKEAADPEDKEEKRP